MPVTEPSLGEIVAGTVEGTIVGVARAISEFKWSTRRPETVFESDGIVVDRIADHTGKHLDQALDLLENEGRIAPDERRSRDDMIRWVRESNEPGWFRHVRIRDHLLVARSGDQVEAMTFFTHYPRDRKSAISYLVARRRSSSYKDNLNRATIAMAKAMAVFHASLRPRVRFLVAEVDDPRLTSSPPERNRRCSRIQLFAKLARIQGVSLRVLDFPYVQPALDAIGGRNERQMLLVVISLDSKYQRESMARDELNGLLRWVYGSLYADAYLGDRVMDTQCRTYLAGFQAKQLERLPEVTACPTAELWLQSLAQARRSDSAAASSV